MRIVKEFAEGMNTNVSVNNAIFYFIYNKNSILPRQHVSTFIRSSSGPLRKQILELSYISMHCGIPNAYRLYYRNVKYRSFYVLKSM